jgi:superfamily II DNA or RNA helicase
MITLRIAANAVRARLIDAPKNVKIHVYELLSYFEDGAENTDSFKSGRWDGKSSFYSFQDDTFPAGFVGAVVSDLKRLGFEVSLLRKKLKPPLGPDLNAAYLDVNPHGLDPRYDYQIEAVRQLERHGQIIARVATGGGKSMIARTAVRRMMRPTLFITTRGVLMHQMKEGFEEAGFRVGVMGDGEWKPVNGVNVAMVQTLASRLSSEEHGDRTRKLLQLFEFAILEEAHEAGGRSYFDVMNACVNCHYRMALTATPFMRSDGESNMRLMAVSGQVAVKISEKMLIDRGILARPIFKFIKFEKDSSVKRFQSWQAAYLNGVVEHKGRNKAIISHALKACSKRMPTLILVQRKMHGEILKHELQAAGVKVQYIFGDHDQKERKQALSDLASGEAQVVIGSTIMDVGVDVPSIGMIILAGAGKAEIGLRQRIGRGLRAKKTGPNVCFVIDTVDTENTYLINHSKARRAIIESTPGFMENILPEGEDFSWDDM